jgi:hypothetical protein
MGLFDVVGDAVGGIAGAAGDALDWTGEAAGDALGTNTHKADVYQVQSGSYENPESDASRAKLQAAQADSLNRTAPTSVR